MGRRRKYVSLEEANRERNAKRRQRRANASANDNSGKYQGTAATMGFSVFIEQPSDGHSAVELRYKGKVSIETEGVNNQDEQHVTTICSHSKGGSIGHASSNRTTGDCAKTAVRGMHECTEETRVDPIVLASTSNNSVAGYSMDACSVPIIADSSVLSTPPGKKCRSVPRGDARQKRRKMLATDPLSIIVTEPDILPDIPDCQHCKASLSPTQQQSLSFSHFGNMGCSRAVFLDCVLLTWWLCLSLAAAAEQVKVKVKGVTSIAKTDGNFICATLDWWPEDKCDYNQCPWGKAGILNLDLKNKILANAIKAFNPLRIRIGGSLEDQVVYKVGTMKICPRFQKRKDGLFGFSRGCLPMKRWDELNALFNKTGPLVTFSLNALIGRQNPVGGDTLWAGDWNAQNARDFINYTIFKGYKIDSWELGNLHCDAN
ncbi:uncharacterized protein [Coffea arabica]|uniref:Heparanase-like protein 2 n=1 Tax=Coffea arabica TaxID=13443 RepID=A0ABM4X0F0_COFAR